MFMNRRWPGSSRFCRKWANNYGFDNKLVLNRCEKLKRQIELELDNPSGKSNGNLQLQLEAANLWILAAQERQNNMKRKHGGAALVAALSSISPDEESPRAAVVSNKGQPQEKATEQRAAAEALDRETLRDDGEGRERKHRELVRLQPYNLSPGRDGALHPPLSKTRSGMAVPSAPLPPLSSSPPPPPLSSSPLPADYPPPPPPGYGIKQTISYTSGDGHPSLSHPEIEDALPLVHVANPHFGLENPDGRTDENRTVLVYRPWSDSEMRAAIEGLTPFKENVDQFCLDIQGLRESYMLNGSEMLRVWRNVFGHHWSRVKGNYSSTNVAGKTLPPGNELDTHVEAVLAEARRIWRPTIDYSRISNCKQNAKESVYEFRGRLEEIFKVNSGLRAEDGDQTPYQQQLKQALMNGFLPGIADFIRKHNVNHKTCSVQECLNYAEQATEVSKKKREKGATKLFVQQDSEGESVLYLNSDSSANSKVQKGKGKNPRGRGKAAKGYSRTFRCFRCNLKGHSAAECETDWGKIQQRKSDKQKQPDNQSGEDDWED